jgi:hypothetical protein
MKYLTIFHGNNGYANVPERYVMRTQIVSILSVSASTLPHTAYTRSQL